MALWLILIQATGAVLSIVALGAVMRWRSWLTHHAEASLLKLVVSVLMPCFLYDHIADNAVLRDVRLLAVAPVAGYTAVAVGCAIGWLVASWLRGPLKLSSRGAVGSFALGSGLFNYGYVPIPVVTLLIERGVLEPAVLAVLFVFNLGVDLAMWTLGVTLVSGRLSGDWWKRAINPPLVAIVGSLALNLAEGRGYVPGFLDAAAGWLGACAIPIALVVIGGTVMDQLREVGWRQRGADWGVIAAGCGLRLGVVPAVFVAAAVAVLPVVGRLAGTDLGALATVLVVQAGMPAATFPIVLARLYGGEPMVVIRVFVSTTLLCLLTMPLWISVGLWLLSG